MKKDWYINWLVIITVCLSLSTLSLFFFSIQDSLGFKKCAYGDVVVNGDKNCICDSNGEVICDDNAYSIKLDEFTAENLFFTYEFLNLVESNEISYQDAKFINISQVGDTLRVLIEKNTFCNQNDEVAQQVGFYKQEKDRITFTVVSNLVDTSFNIPCISEVAFEIINTQVKYDSNMKLFYQDQFGTLIPSGNCSYEGFLRNDEDVYNSSDGCSICICKTGQNVCEQESKCLK